jgi:hypothetical protein
MHINRKIILGTFRYPQASRESKLLKSLFLKCGCCYLLALLGSGCGLIRKVEKEVYESSQKLETAVINDSLSLYQENLKYSALVSNTDSAAVDFILEIWPKGRFSISSHGVFEGEAEKLRLYGHGTAVNKSFQKLHTVATTSSLTSLNKLDFQKIRGQQKHTMTKKNPAWPWALVILSVLILGSLFYTKSLWTNK